WLNNVAIPGATSLDPTAEAGTAASNALTQFILGGKTQVARALDANPTFVSIWIGNNDVLGAAVAGILTPVPGATAGVTPVAQFQANYDAMMDGLSAGTSLRGGVLIGVVQVAAAPILFPAPAVLNPQFKAGLDSLAGQALAVDASCS